VLAPQFKEYRASDLTMATQKCYQGCPQEGAQSFTISERRMALLSTTIVATFGSWLIVSSLSIYPHSLSYFNELVGGPLNGAMHVLGSNIDWGQDLRYLKWWCERNNVSKPHVAYHGNYHPTDVGFEFSELSPISSISASDALRVGVSAVSVNYLGGFSSAPWKTNDGPFIYSRDAFAGFRLIRPKAMAGYSLRIFGPAKFDQRRESK
jgi:hypothetical protein